MADSLQGISLNPSVAIARIGGSSTPQDAFTWAAGRDPRSGDDTAIIPEWTLDVQPDGSVKPRMPAGVSFRDGALIRPVSPFFEVWAHVGEAGSPSSTWRTVPLTPALLSAFGAAPRNLLLRVEAVNAKAARRRRDPDLRFGTFPPLEVRADRLSEVEVKGVSPRGAKPPMIPAGRFIPMGKIRFVRSVPQPPAGAAAWAGAVNVEIIRFRYTPPKGRFYGPPRASKPAMDEGRPYTAVPESQAFLDPKAGWFNRATRALDLPADTYDVLGENTTGASLGVVDDTSDARLTIVLELPGRPPLTAMASLFTAPPDFAPDRRPFLSLSDEINDRTAGQAERSQAMTAAEKDRWIEDLFERIFETVSLMNVDYWRNIRAKPLSPGERAAVKKAGDGLDDNRAMGAADRLRMLGNIPPAVPGFDPLPLSEHARARHRALADIEELKRLVRTHPDRLQALVRPPFEVERGENPNQSNMKMPPFMRNSNAQPLSLAAWQYNLLMDWARDIATLPAPSASRMSRAASTRLSAVLRRATGGRP